MVEVFKTNVTSKKTAEKIIHHFQKTHPSYKVNFDLEDVDHILRVECNTAVVDTASIIEQLKRLGYKIEVLPDTISQYKPNDTQTFRKVK